jgi:hypothetical protein
LLDRRRRLRPAKAVSAQAADGSVIEDATESETKSDVAVADVTPASVRTTDDSVIEKDATVIEKDATEFGDDAPVTGNSADADVADVAADGTPPRRRRVRLRTAEPSTVSAMNGSVSEANGAEMGVVLADELPKRAVDGARSYRANGESSNGDHPAAESIDSDSSDEGVLDAAKATAAADGR